MCRYITLAEYFWLAEQVTGIDALTMSKVSRIELADSALNAPRASFAGTYFYPDVIDKAAVLVGRLAGNHPLPDGNKRASWAALNMFLTLNGFKWKEAMPEVNEAERMMIDSASRQTDEEMVAPKYNLK